MKKKLGLLWATIVWFTFLVLVVVVPNYQELVEDHSIWIAVAVLVVVGYAAARTLNQTT
jgi:hypothetical protein